MNRVLLVLTAQCNLHCAYCFQNARKPLRMQWETLKAGVDLAAGGKSGTTLIFSGGEPLLEFEHLRRVVDYAESIPLPAKNIRYRLNTNGLLLTAVIADYLDAHKFSVQLSFDGIAAAQDYRGNRTFAALDGLLDSLRCGYPNLFRHRLQVVMTLTPLAIRHMARSVEYFIEKEVAEISIVPGIAPQMEWATENIAELEQQIEKIAEISRRHLDRTGHVPVLIFRKAFADDTGGNGGHRLCGGLRGTSLAVDVDGQVYGCPFFAESYQEFPAGSLMADLKVLRMGDVREPGLLDRCDAAARAARSIIPSNWAVLRYSSYSKCCECPYAAGCSICPVSIWSKQDDNDPFRVPDFVCAFNQVVLKYRQRFPCAPGAIRDLLPPDGSDPIEPLEAYLRSRQK